MPDVLFEQADHVFRTLVRDVMACELLPRTTALERDEWSATRGALRSVGDAGLLSLMFAAGAVCVFEDDRIVIGGENVYPREVEEVLYRCPGVLEAAVVGLPDARWGQGVAVFVVRNAPGLEAGHIDAFCRASEELAAFERPRRIEFVPTLPMNPSGKVPRRELVARALGLISGARPLRAAGARLRPCAGRRLPARRRMRRGRGWRWGEHGRAGDRCG